MAVVQLPLEMAEGKRKVKTRERGGRPGRARVSESTIPRTNSESPRDKGAPEVVYTHLCSGRGAPRISRISRCRRGGRCSCSVVCAKTFKN